MPQNTIFWGMFHLVTLAIFSSFHSKKLAYTNKIYFINKTYFLYLQKKINKMDFVVEILENKKKGIEKELKKNNLMLHDITEASRELYKISQLKKAIKLLKLNGKQKNHPYSKKRNSHSTHTY